MKQTKLKLPERERLKLFANLYYKKDISALLNFLKLTDRQKKIVWTNIKKL